MKYEVQITQKELYYFSEIEAESRDEAENKALELFESDKKYEYHYDSDTDIECYEIE